MWCGPTCAPQTGIASPGWQPDCMIDEYAKAFLHEEPQWTRDALVWKLDGLSEYDIRRPLTVTGTNLLGLVKHMATWEARYLGEIFGRPFPERLLRWQDSDGSDLWVAKDESREQIVSFYERACRHADATINELPIDASGHVPWWPRPDVKVFSIMVHVLNDTIGTLATRTSCVSSSMGRPVSPPNSMTRSTLMPARFTVRRLRARPEQPRWTGRDDLRTAACKGHAEGRPQRRGE